MTWMHQVRRRILWIAVGVGLTTLGVISVTTIPAWPLVGVAVATLAIAINRVAGRLSEPTCYGCGENLVGQPQGEHGTICPHCGSINQWVADGAGGVDVEDLASAGRDDHRA